jgi:hypothetical protein
MGYCHQRAKKRPDYYYRPSSNADFSAVQSHQTFDGQDELSLLQMEARWSSSHYCSYCCNYCSRRYSIEVESHFRIGGKPLSHWEVEQSFCWVIQACWNTELK